MKKGFTLTELVITIVVIGVIAVLLLPNVLKIMPDKNLALFKKGNNAFFESIKTLVNSDTLFLDGKFEKTPRGKIVTCKYFCEAMAKTLQTKSIDCDIEDNKNGSLGVLSSNNQDVMSAAKIDFENSDRISMHSNNGLEVVSSVSDLVNLNEPQRAQSLLEGIPEDELKKETFSVSKCIGIPLNDSNRGSCGNSFARHEWLRMENSCLDNQKEQIVLNDDIVFYQPGGTNFKQLKNNINNYRKNERYKVFCMDIDGINKGEEPFAYAVNEQGRIVPGCKAQNWINKSLSKRGEKYEEIDCSDDSFDPSNDNSIENGVLPGAGTGML